jgi:hypothetical protein
VKQYRIEGGQVVEKKGVPRQVWPLIGLALAILALLVGWLITAVVW